MPFARRLKEANGNNQWHNSAKVFQICGYPWKQLIASIETLSTCATCYVRLIMYVN